MNQNKNMLDCYLDLRRLSSRSCLSVRTLRYAIKSKVDPLPVHRVGQKILVRWSDFTTWMETKREKTVDFNTEDLVDSMLSRLK